MDNNVIKIDNKKAINLVLRKEITHQITESSRVPKWHDKELVKPYLVGLGLQF